MLRHVWSREAVSNVIIPAIRFSPTANLLAWTDVDGSLTRWVGPIPSTHAHPSRQPSSIISKTSKPKVVSHEDQKHLNDMFDAGEDLGAADEDLKDKMALGNEDGDVYDDGWVIDDEDEPGNGVLYRAGQNEGMDHDETGPREMGKCAISGRGPHANEGHSSCNISQCYQGPTSVSTGFDTVPKQEKISW